MNELINIIRMGQMKEQFLSGTGFLNVRK